MIPLRKPLVFGPEHHEPPERLQRNASIVVFIHTLKDLHGGTMVEACGFKLEETGDFLLPQLVYLRSVRLRFNTLLEK